MKLMHTLSALTLLALPLSAQIAVEASANAVIASGDMNRMVLGNNLTGASLGLGLRIPIAAGFGHRVHLDLFGMKGAPGTGLEGAGPKHLAAGWDLTQDLNKKWTLYGGLMAVKWKQDEGKVTNPNFGDIARTSPNGQLFPATGNTNNSPKGTKLGARIGVEYTFSKALSMNLGFQQTEFNKIYQPGWFGLGVTYKFAAF